jgi:hypothetical protein
MVYSVAGLAERRKVIPQSAKVGVLLFIVAFLVTRDIKPTVAIVFTHWFGHSFLFPSI